MGVMTLTLISSHAQYTHPVSIIVLSCLVYRIGCPNTRDSSNALQAATWHLERYRSASSPDSTRSISAINSFLFMLVRPVVRIMLIISSLRNSIALSWLGGAALRGGGVC